MSFALTMANLTGGPGFAQTTCTRTPLLSLRFRLQGSQSTRHAIFKCQTTTYTQHILASVRSLTDRNPSMTAAVGKIAYKWGWNAVRSKTSIECQRREPELPLIVPAFMWYGQHVQPGIIGQKRRSSPSTAAPTETLRV